MRTRIVIRPNCWNKGSLISETLHPLKPHENVMDNPYPILTTVSCEKNAPLLGSYGKRYWRAGRQIGGRA